MAIQTFGVNDSHIQSYLAQLDIQADAPITPTRSAEIIEGFSAYLASIVIYAYGSDLTSDFASDSASVVYRNCQRLITILSVPDYIRAAFMQADGILDNAIEERNELLKRLQRTPQMEIGYVVADQAQVINGTSNSVKYLSLDTTDPVASTRRRYDGRANGRKEGGFQW